MSNDIILTPEQEEAVNLIKNFLKSDNDESIFTLAGVGGSGKTTCIRKALESKSNVVGATISHSAKFVLAQSLKNIASCYTIAQLLGLRQYINDDGKITFVPMMTDKPLPIDSASILVIDECSMIDDKTLNMIMSKKNDWSKIIFLGDPYQLPPIEGSDDSKTFDYTKCELFEAVRYSGPIADLGLIIRKEIDKLNEDKPATKNVINHWMTGELSMEGRTSLVNEEGSGIIFLNDIDLAVKIAVEEFKNNNNPEAMRLIAYKNSSITKINDVIRNQIYYDEKYLEENKEGEMELMLPEFMQDELIISDGGYAVYDENGKRHSVIYNNQTFKVKGTIEIDNGPSGVPSLAMDLNPEVSLPQGTEIYVMNYENEEGRRFYWDTINKLKANAKKDYKQWPIYHNFIQQFAWFSYSYAINSHKGQGRTFKDTIVFENDIFNIKKNTLKQKLQAMYVACTRASRRIYIYNERFRVDQSLLPENVKEELKLLKESI